MATVKPVKIQKRGSNYQLYYYNPQGERRRISVGSDRDLAQRRAVKFSDWLLEGKDPEVEIESARKGEESKNYTLTQLYPVFIERHGRFQSKSMQQIYFYRFECIRRCPSLSEIPICKITKNLIHEYMSARKKQDEASNATVNREAALIKSMLFRAVEWDIIETNPLRGFRLLPEGKRDVNVPIGKIAELISCFDHPMSDIVEFAFYTGFRKENVLSLKIEDIRFHDVTKTGEVYLRLKGNKEEVFPLGESAVNLLKRLISKRKEGFVFINPKTGTRYLSILHTFDRAVKKVGIEVNGTKLRFHDIRHIFASTLVRSGVSLEKVRVLLGHEDRSTTDRYATIEPLDAMDSLKSIPSMEKVYKGCFIKAS
ncbi:MAG: tyrosine-type recombinase/integrase [Candidatus Latescibacterota bacterium]